MFPLVIFRRASLLLFLSIGGSIPIVFSYYSEFLAQEKRGEHLSWLCMFWMFGGIYAAAMAWAIIPHYGETINGCRWEAFCPNKEQLYSLSHVKHTSACTSVEGEGG